MGVYDSGMNISVLPKTSWGRWSISLAGAFVILYISLQAFYTYVHRNPVPNPGPPSPFILIGVTAEDISGIGAFITGLISMIKSKERSIFVFLVVALGCFALIWLLGELLFSH
jgi:hypothetical protein